MSNFFVSCFDRLVKKVFIFYDCDLLCQENTVVFSVVVADKLKLFQQIDRNTFLRCEMKVKFMNQVNLFKLYHYVWTFFLCAKMLQNIV